MPSQITKAPTVSDVIAWNGNRREIPDVKQLQGQASIELGFPPETMMRPTQGGVPPQGVDFNGLFYLLGQFAFYQQSGGGFEWSAERDYIIGCEVFGSNGIKYRCVQANGINYGGPKDPTVEGNSHNFGNDPTTPWLNLDSAYQPVDTGSLVPVGTVSAYAGETAPDGWLLCNGDPYSKITYAELFNVIGNDYGDTSTTFNVPDLRGYFVRGLDTRTTGAVDQWYEDNGQTVPRKLGDVQTFAIENITGTVGEMRSDDARKIVSDEAGSYNPTNPFYQYGEYYEGETSFSSRYTDFKGEKFDASRNVNTSTETRPSNLAMNYIIKY